jgi:hypothetical protein
LQTKVVEKIKTDSVFNNFFSENRFVYEIFEEKNMVEPDSTSDDNTAHALCMPDH